LAYVVGEQEQVWTLQRRDGDVDGGDGAGDDGKGDEEGGGGGESGDDGEALLLVSVPTLGWV